MYNSVDTNNEGRYVLADCTDSHRRHDLQPGQP